jgi:CheY-like chemotaxis protein
VAASTIVEAVLRLQRRTFDKSITVRTDISPDLWVLGNASRLEQVIMNLCLNARDAMPEGGDLSVRARPAQVAGHALVDDGDYVEIQVSDTGSGMDAEAAERAFEPFFTRKGPGGGSGLGLAVVYGIVQSHRGFVELRTAQGEGSTFVVTLPSAEPLARADAFEARPRAEGAGVEVLLVDDEDGFRRATKRQLIQRGYRVQSARNGEEAVGIAKADPRRFSVVMLDLVMPGLDGEQTYAALRAAGLEAPVLLMSGYEGGHRVQRILDGGAAAFLRKPFTPGVMDDALRNLRATHRADHSA